MARYSKPYDGADNDNYNNLEKWGKWTEDDFDTYINKIQTPLYSKKKLKRIAGETSFIIEELGSFKSMSTQDKNNILILARRAVNTFNTQYKQIVNDDALKMYRDNYSVIGEMLKDLGVKTRSMTEPNWKEINRILMGEKFNRLKYYTNRSVFMLERRMTLFELQGKKDMQDNIINFIAQNRGKMTHQDMLKDLLTLIDENYPAGYIKVPVIKIINGEQVLSYRKLHLETYVSTWISDVEGAIHYTALRSGYLKAKIDLVLIKNHSVYVPLTWDTDPNMSNVDRLQKGVKNAEKNKKHKKDDPNVCPICEPDVGKLFSLTGADPTFPRMSFFLPRHPHCNCYMAPMPQDIPYPSDEAIAAAHEPKKIEKGRS